MRLLMIFILLYYITDLKIFFWIGWIIGIGWLASIAFIIGTFIPVYINLF